MKVNSINRVYESVNNPTNKSKREKTYKQSFYKEADSFEKVLRDDMSTNEEAYKKAKQHRKKEVIVDEEYLLWAFENAYKIEDDISLPKVTGNINEKIDFSKIPNIYHFLNKFYDINYATLAEVFEIGSFLIDTNEISYEEFNNRMDNIIKQIGYSTTIDIKNSDKSNTLRISWTGVFAEYIHSLEKVGNYSESEKYKNINNIFKNIENSNKKNLNIGHNSIIHIG